MNTDPRWAFHEAGHVASAMLAGIPFRVASINPDNPDLHGFVKFDKKSAYADPFLRGFVHFSGPASEARYTNTPLSEVVQSHSSSADLPHFVPYLSREQVSAWQEDLDSIWSVVTEVAAMLLVSGTLRPRQKHPLRDAEALRRFAASIGVDA